MANFKSLKYLDLSADTRSSVHPRTISLCTGLTELSIRKVVINPDTLQAILLQNRHLRVLNLHYNVGIGELNVLTQVLDQCANLEKLCIFEGMTIPLVMLSWLVLKVIV